MTPTILVPVDAAAAARQATFDMLWNARTVLERAVGSLGKEREKVIAQAIDTFCSASKTTTTGAEALKAHLDLEALKKSFNDREAALHAWTQEAGDRFDRMADRHPADADAVLNSYLKTLKQEEASQHDTTENVRSQIKEIEQVRAEILKRSAVAARKSSSRSEAS
jgi:hypothetical protein